MARLTILAAGNGDVHDCLHALREDDTVTWNGINAVLRERRPPWSARVIHRTMTRSDAVLAADGVVPAALVGRAFPPAPFTAGTQHAPDMFEIAADVVVLSIQADVMHPLCRHREDGHYLYPFGIEAWPEAARRAIVADYRPVAPLTAEASMANFARIVARLRRSRSPHILVFNMSAAMPGERMRCYQGCGETLAERIRRFNLALIGLSRSTGIAIVDVDAVLADAGARGLKLDAVSLSAPGCRLVADEVVDVLDELGALDPPR